MMNTNRRWIVCVLFLLIIQISAGSPNYKTLYNEDKFLMEGILQLLPIDLNDDGKSELMVAGKNYTSEELFLYCLEFAPDCKPYIRWRSANLFEERSILWVAQGNFNGTGHQVLVATNSKYYFYNPENTGLKLVKTIAHQSDPLAVTAGDVDGDGVAEIITARVGKVENQAYNCLLQFWKLQGDLTVKTSESNLLGNIRGLASGDLDGDGQNEILVEEGLRVNGGTIHVYNWTNGKLKERWRMKLTGNRAVYALKVREFPAGGRLVTASVNGKVNILAKEESFVPAIPEITMKTGLVDIEAADLDGDAEPELIVAGYPRKFTILGKQ
jgi:hypothetical protein